MDDIKLPSSLTNAFWRAQGAYTRLEAEALNAKRYRQTSRLVGDFFARALDHVIKASTAGSAETRQEAIRDAVSFLSRINQECGELSSVPDSEATSTTSDELPTVTIPHVVVDCAKWTSSIVVPIRALGPLPTRVLMEGRDGLYHLVIAAELQDEDQRSAHIAQATEHIVMAGQEAIEYVIRQNLNKAGGSFFWHKNLARFIVGKALPRRDWRADLRAALLDLSEARRYKGRPERLHIFEDNAKRALDTSVELANATDQGKIPLWRIILDLAVGFLGATGALIGIIKAFS